MIYFAYGPDLNPSHMMERSPGYRSIGIARLADCWIDFPRHSSGERSAVISIVESPGSYVWGVLYDIRDEDIPILDHVHGFDPDRPEDLNDHVLREVTVQRPGHPKPVSASTYVAVPDGRVSQPTASYLVQIIDGARYHGLPKAYLGALQAVRTVS